MIVPLPDLWLDPIPVLLRPEALAALRADDAEGFLATAETADWLSLVSLNIRPLRMLRIYERLLLRALVALRMNCAGYRVAWLRYLLSLADPVRLRAAGDPLRSWGPFVLYRGVAGRGTQRRVKGVVWTSDQAYAAQVAAAFVDDRGDGGAVFRITVALEQVLAHLRARVGDPELFVIDLPRQAQPRKLASRPRRRGHEQRRR